ncbi:MAG: septum site-determining protein MinC [Anaerolineae bacterium]|nr:MAG: septum site-determining protein MinC [Anaerolineae bacterium]WKZ42313.1 MAG: septum site-determining protein MinC [Anaerolineales bacterium]
MEETKSLIQIKGLRDGLLISLDDAPWDEQHAALIAQVDSQPAFFQGARLALDVASQVLHVNELVELRDQLSDRGISLWAVMSESPTTEQTAQLLGLATRISKPRPEETRQFSVEDLGEETALFLNRTLRSGTRIEFPGHVVVLGDVNPGAEIIAEGNIVIWGRLRGMVHAGSGGDISAVVCALDLSPTQLRIADEVATTIRPSEEPQPEMARINEEGKLQSENWSADR